MIVGVGRKYGSSCWPLQSEPAIALDNDAYYWFLRPLLERLDQETGQWIDLYGDARFAGDDLQGLERMLTAADELVRSQPATWQVHIGTQTYRGKHSEVYYTAHRARFQELLTQWRQVVARARQMKRAVVCFGD